MRQITVHKGRTVTVLAALGYDVSSDVITSEIRESEHRTSPIIATWSISFATDGTDGELVLVLDDSITTAITKSVGYMDLKRIKDGEPLSVIDKPIEVIFKETVTV